MADKTKLIWANGSTIKQGDTSSVFRIKLLTEDEAELNGPAKLQLIDSNKAKIEYDVDIVDNIVEFKLDRVLPADVYIVEVEHAGYVFPSTNSEKTTLKINENLGDYITDEVAKLLSIDEYIKQKLADYQTGQIDLDELASKLNIPQYDDGPLTAQIGEILAEISLLKESQGQSVQYDDSGIRSQISALSEHLETIQLTPGPVGPQGEPGMDGQDGPQGLPGKDGKSAYQIAVDNGFVGSELDWLESLKGNNSSSSDTRFGPTGWFLDRSASPWQFRFDNGSSLTLGNVDQRAYIYSESAPLTIDKLSEYRVVLSLMRTANGSVPISSWSSANTVARFWGGAEVTNPVNDASLFDFSKAMYNPNDTSGPSKRSQPILIRCYYELGVFTEEDILSFGVVKR
ncbi:collagen-like protein [Streptococcus suis]|uniref:collagen-like protein n=1 Tax=Streptococcus suis TaxID=1307 RepID=UPI001ABEB594|nr:collagen-like protein [Streptococcus suis]